jgi:hypothetical protein
MSESRVMGFIWFLIMIATAMIGHTIHHSLFWSIIDFFFVPFAWLKWLICKQVTLAIIKATFVFFFAS